MLEFLHTPDGWEFCFGKRAGHGDTHWLVATNDLQYIMIPINDSVIESGKVEMSFYPDKRSLECVKKTVPTTQIANTRDRLWIIPFKFDFLIVKLRLGLTYDSI